VRGCFDELINHRWSEISSGSASARATCSAPPTKSRSSTPSPSSCIPSASDNYIIPISVVEKIDDATTSSSTMRTCHAQLSRAYQRSRDKKKFEGENKEFISSKLNSANWMIRRSSSGVNDAQGDELHRRLAARLLRRACIPQPLTLREVAR
jgi:RNA polymerase sigma-54 factor